MHTTMTNLTEAITIALTGSTERDESGRMAPQSGLELSLRVRRLRIAGRDEMQSGEQVVQKVVGNDGRNVPL